MDAAADVQSHDGPADARHSPDAYASDGGVTHAADGSASDATADAPTASQPDASPDAGPDAATGTPNIIFVSSQTFNGAMGGAAGADAQCQALAQGADLGGTFIAYISTSTASAASRVQNARGWVRTDGKPVADLASQLTAGNLWYPVYLDEHGAPVAPTALTYTGSNADGTTSPSYTCSDWTSSSATTKGECGEPAAGFSQWSGGPLNACNQAFHLYCLQASNTAVVPKPNAQGRRIFLGRFPSNVLGNFNLAGADAECQSEAKNASLPGTFLALLATTGATPTSRFDTTGPTWVRPDGVEVFAHATDLATWTLEAPITDDATGFNIGSQYPWPWVGAATPTTQGTVDSTCADWSYAVTAFAVKGLSAAAGYMGNVSGKPGIWDTTSTQCAVSGDLYCLESTSTSPTGGTCVGANGGCSASTDCCSGLTCFGSKCVASCAAQGASCAGTACCDPTNHCSGTCNACSADGQTCALDTDCCSGSCSSAKTCATTSCYRAGAACGSTPQCCQPLVCETRGQNTLCTSPACGSFGVTCGQNSDCCSNSCDLSQQLCN